MSLRKAAEMAWNYFRNADDITVEGKQVMEALRQALAQPEYQTVSAPQPQTFTGQKPVAWIGLYKGIASELAFQDFDIVVDADWTRLPLYTAPPKREWVGLTDEERDECINGTAWVGEEKEVRVKIVEAIEAKLREKNT